MSQYYPMKAVFEQVLGNRTYLKLKETGSFSDWKKAAGKLLKAIKLSILETVQVADDDYFRQVHFEIEHGEKIILSTQEIDELLPPFRPHSPELYSCRLEQSLTTV
jgi:hypothetical protein